MTTEGPVTGGEGMLARARAGDEEAFGALVEPHRRELLAHCYRMLGSLHDAEDVLQETLLAAWRGLGGFAGGASLRTWLYRIATNRCLNAIRDRGRRPSSARGEPLWLEPFPDALLDELPDVAPGPDARYETREALGLAFVAGLQRLPPRQRAVLVLRDALGLPAREVAEVLDDTEASVNSALQRARSAIDGRSAGRSGAALPRSARERAALARFADAFERGDVGAVVDLLTDDAWLTMPPEPLEVQGARAIGAFLSDISWWGSGRLRLAETGANGQPAFAYWLREPGAAQHALAGLLVLELADGRIAALTRFSQHALGAGFLRTLTTP